MKRPRTGCCVRTRWRRSELALLTCASKPTDLLHVPGYWKLRRTRQRNGGEPVIRLVVSAVMMRSYLRKRKVGGVNWCGGHILRGD